MKYLYQSPSLKLKNFYNHLFIWQLLFVGIFISLCSCNKAEDSIEIPSSFSRKDIYAVIKHARRNHIDPDRINENLSYVKSARSSLQSLPNSLLLFSKEYYINRAKWEPESPLTPGRPIYLNKNDSWLIFSPDYDKWEKILKKYKKERRKRNKKLSDIERRKVFSKERKVAEKVRRARNNAWEKVKFNSSHFASVLTWIEKNWGKYKELPEVYKKKQKKKRNFGLHETYFAAANGFLRAMDPHCALLPQSSWKKMLSESEDASFEGIGAMLRGGGTNDVIVETPLPGSPALGAGLRAGDIILKVDGKPIENMHLSDVVKRIRGPRETKVVLHVERPTELRNLDVSIKRGVIKQLAVTNELINSKTLDAKITGKLQIGVIHIKSFLYAKRKTNQLVIKAYKNLLRKSNLKMDALVLDLRGNPGGYLEEAVSVADIFLPKKKSVVTIRAKGKSKTLSTSRSALIKDMPIIVLINSGSASASEILASALMDHNAALILGERSFGKATVQSVEPSISGTMIKITSARYYAPNNYTVQVAGLEPDIKISGEEDDSFPPRFREEDMWDHLPRLNKYKLPAKRVRWAKRLQSIVAKKSLSGAYIAKHKNDALRPDYMLIRSIAYIKALKRYPKP